MYKTILVPIDLAHPEKGRPMIDLARLVGDKDARVMLVNVVEGVSLFVAGLLPEEALENARKQAGEQLKAIANAAGIKPDYEVCSGSPYVAVLDLAQKQGADLIIVGSHKPGLQDYLLGSTAAQIVRHAKCTVLVGR